MLNVLTPPLMIPRRPPAWIECPTGDVSADATAGCRPRRSQKTTRILPTPIRNEKGRSLASKNASFIPRAAVWNPDGISVRVLLKLHGQGSNFRIPTPSRYCMFTSQEARLDSESHRDKVGSFEARLNCFHSCCFPSHSDECRQPMEDI